MTSNVELDQKIFAKTAEQRPPDQVGPLLHPRFPYVLIHTCIDLMILVYHAIGSAGDVDCLSYLHQMMRNGPINNNSMH